MCCACADTPARVPHGKLARSAGIAAHTAVASGALRGAAVHGGAPVAGGPRAAGTGRVSHGGGGGGSR